MPIRDDSRPRLQYRGPDGNIADVSTEDESGRLYDAAGKLIGHNSKFENDSYGTWNNDDLTWLDLIKATASDSGNALSNLGRNLVDGFSPIGTSEQGNMALQVPPVLSGIADSYSRLAGTPNNPGNAYALSGVPELDAPIQQDMSNVLLSLYGGNAAAGLAKRPIDAAVLDKATPPVLGRINRPTARQFDTPSSHLPMDPESRLARAKEQGYDVDNIYWHGSPNEPFDAFDVNRFGERDSFWGDGVYADGSANGESTARAHTYSPDMHDPFAEWNQGHYRALVSRSEKPFLMERGWPENIKSVFPEYRVTPGTGIYADQTTAFRQALLDNGYDSIRSRDRSHDVFLRPEQLRDVNAAFDPAHVGDNGLLLSDNRPSLLGSALATGGENPHGITPLPQNGQRAAPMSYADMEQRLMAGGREAQSPKYTAEEVEAQIQALRRAMTPTSTEDLPPWLQF